LGLFYFCQASIYIELSPDHALEAHG